MSSSGCGSPQAAGSDFVFVNLFRAPVGAPLRPDAVGELIAAARAGPGWTPPIRAHRLRHAFGSNIADVGGGIDVLADLLGHASVSSVAGVCASRPVAGCVRRWTGAQSPRADGGQPVSDDLADPGRPRKRARLGGRAGTVPARAGQCGAHRAGRGASRVGSIRGSDRDRLGPGHTGVVPTGR